MRVGSEEKVLGRLMAEAFKTWVIPWARRRARSVATVEPETKRNGVISEHWEEARASLGSSKGGVSVHRGGDVGHKVCDVGHKERWQQPTVSYV